jgi:hypothetical protein
MLKEYFEKATGRGVLATAGKDGAVDVAVYSRPHVVDEETIAYIMTDRLTHSNLESNPHAAYLFFENREGFAGKRLYLTKTGEETDPETIARFRWKKSYVMPDEQKGEKRFLVYFHVDKILPLVGVQEK